MAGLALLAGSCWAEPADPSPDGGERVTLAVLASGDGASEATEHLADILVVELSAVESLQLVDRAELEKVIKEQELSRRGLSAPEESISVGKLVGAQYLLWLGAAGSGLGVRLTEVATTRVCLEESVKAFGDPFLTVASIREKVLRSLGLRTDVRDRITVGVAALQNRSPSERSDKLAGEIEMAIRKRLRRETWAVIAERQYPTALLDERELARLGFARNDGEMMRPAEMVILGSLNELDRTFAGGAWRVSVEGHIRFRGKTSSFKTECSSDAVAQLAEAFIEKADPARRQTDDRAQVVESENDLWRRLALYLMPGFGQERALRSNRGREEQDVLQAIRAWENVLLIKPENREAKVKLALCLIAVYGNYLNPRFGEKTEIAREQVLRGSYLIEEVFRGLRTKELAEYYVGMANCLSSELRERGREMYEFVLANSRLYSERQLKQVRLKQGYYGFADKDKDPIFSEVEKAIQAADTSPKGTFKVYDELLEKYERRPDVIFSFAKNHLKARNSLVRFLSYRTVGRVSAWPRNDPKALAFFDLAIGAHEAAYRDVEGYPFDSALDRIYMEAMAACSKFGEEEKAHRMLLRGANFYMKQKRFTLNIAELWHHCVTRILGDGDADLRLRICDAFIRAGRYGPQDTTPYDLDIVLLQERLRVRAEDGSLPGFEAMARIVRSGAPRPHECQLTVSGGKLWFASGGSVYRLVPGSDDAVRLELPARRARCLAGNDQRVFVGCTTYLSDGEVRGGGILELDLDGQVVHEYNALKGNLPAGYVADLCFANGKLYAILWESDTSMVLSLEPSSRQIRVLAPTSRKTERYAEPTGSQVYKLWWHAVNSRLYANRFYPRTDGTYMNYWVLEPAGWNYLTNKSRDAALRFHYAVTQGNEVVEMKTPEEDNVFRFLPSREEVNGSPSPAQWARRRGTRRTCGCRHLRGYTKWTERQGRRSFWHAETTRSSIRS